MAATADGAEDALGRVADELYGGSPDDFVRVRGERVKEARTAKNRALATAIGELRRPTRSAWTVNLLARGAADELGALLELGAALRAAQESLSGAELRRLSGERHRAVEALVRRAARLATEAGATPTEAVRREIGQTLQIALADPGVADRVRSGRLATVPEYGGFGPFTAGDVVPAAPPVETGSEPEPADDATEDPAAAAEREARLDRARAAVERADTAVGGAEQSLEDAQGEAQTAADDLASLRARIEQAEQRAADTEQAVTDARGTLDRLRAEAAEARTALDALDALAR